MAKQNLQREAMQKSADLEKLERPAVEALENLLGTKFKVLDDGFIRIIDYMGSDESIVQAARVSYGKGTKRIHEDRGLIRYLMRHQHTTPFEMCEIKLHVRVPMDCWRQWIRHRTASANEYSTRYSVAIDAAQKTSPSTWRRQSAKGRQGSEGLLDLEAGEALSEQEETLHNTCRKVYEQRLVAGVAREQARKDLPLSTYTEAYWKIDLHNLLHFLALRMDDHAQEEIREYATVIGKEIVSKWCPITWEAFLDYRLQAIRLSRLEIDIIGALTIGNHLLAIEIANKYGILSEGHQGLKPNRERNELESKLLLLKLPIPWVN